MHSEGTLLWILHPLVPRHSITVRVSHRVCDQRSLLAASLDDGVVGRFRVCRHPRESPYPEIEAGAPVRWDYFTTQHSGNDP